jgi:hypothetical protein
LSFRGLTGHRQQQVALPPIGGRLCPGFGAGSPVSWARLCFNAAIRFATGACTGG